ncbi:hypothetical protein ACI8AC_19985 [Geodermatophilus sp. SYSU D00758]
MNLRRNGRRSAVVGAGAATLTAAALVLGPGTAVGAPADPVGEATQAAQDAAETAQQAAEDAARAAQDAADQAARAAQDAADAAGDAAQDAAGDVDVPADHMDWLPEDLRQDLEAVQDLPADERADRLQQIFSDAVAGEYGEQVENWAERMLQFLDQLPADLRNDLQGVVGMEPRQAQEQLQQIWQGVLGGEYGEDVRMWGRWLQQTFQQWDLGTIIQGMDSGSMMNGS